MQRAVRLGVRVPLVYWADPRVGRALVERVEGGRSLGELAAAHRAQQRQGGQGQGQQGEEGQQGQGGAQEGERRTWLHGEGIAVSYPTRARWLLQCCSILVAFHGWWLPIAAVIYLGRAGRQHVCRHATKSTSAPPWPRPAGGSGADAPPSSAPAAAPAPPSPASDEVSEAELSRVASELGRQLALLHDSGQQHGGAGPGAVLVRAGDGAVVGVGHLGGMVWWYEPVG